MFPDKNKRYNILFCYQNNMNPHHGGVQKVSSLLTDYFIKKGHNVLYLVHEKKIDDDYLCPVKIFHLPGEHFFSVINLSYYHNLLNSESIDFIINNDASNARSKLFLNTGKATAKKISLHHNDPLVRFQVENAKTGIAGLIPLFILKFYKMYKTRTELFFLINNSDRVVMLSRFFLEAITIKTGIRCGKMLAISNPVMAVDQSSVIEKKKQVLYVGRIEMKQKRLDLLLNIWGRIYSICTDWELIILGDGPDRNKAENLSKEMKLANVSFKGYVDPMPFYKDAAVICMTSDYEGFGMVLIEAMQYRMVPVAFDNWVSLKDIIEDGETGILVPPRQTELYATKLLAIISNPGLRKKMGEKAAAHVQQFDINNIGKKWDLLFDEMSSD